MKTAEEILLKHKLIYHNGFHHVFAPMAITANVSQLIEAMEEYRSQPSDVSDEITVYAVLFNPCTYESCAGVVSLHYTRKEAEMALEYSKNERIKEYERELDDDEVYFIQEFPIKAMQSGKIKPLATEKDKEEEIEREALILAKKHAKFSVGDFAVGFNWGAKYIKNKTV